MMPEGRLYNVKLRFLPEVAHGIAEVQWHSTQTVTFEDDGSAIVQFRVDGLNEIGYLATVIRRRCLPLEFCGKESSK